MGTVVEWLFVFIAWRDRTVKWLRDQTTKLTNYATTIVEEVL
jgi:hypothetical protein